MSRVSEETIFQRRYADGQQIHEKMLNITINQGNANQNHSEKSPHICQKRYYIKKKNTSQVVQWLRKCSPNAGGPGLIPGQGTRSQMPQLRVPMRQLKIPHAAMTMEYPTCRS